MKKRLTKEEISKEFEFCKQKVDELLDKGRNADSVGSSIAYLKEALTYADRMSELDTMNKKLLLKDFKKQRWQLLKKVIKGEI